MERNKWVVTNDGDGLPASPDDLICHGLQEVSILAVWYNILIVVFESHVAGGGEQATQEFVTLGQVGISIKLESREHWYSNLHLHTDVRLSCICDRCCRLFWTK